MSIVLDGTNGITTPDVDTDGLTVDTNTLFVDAANNRVGVGTTAPAHTLQVNSGAATSTARLQADAGVNPTVSFLRGVFDVAQINGAFDGLQMNGSQVIRLDTGGSERARIDASGNLLVGTTSLPSAGSGGVGFQPTTSARTLMLCSSSATVSATLIGFLNPNGVVGSIATSGSATAYNTSSDYRLKEDVQPMVGSVDRLMALKPVNFAWTVDGSRVDGFLAHEAQEVVPECVTGEKDAVDAEGNPEYQGIDQSKIVPLLTAALQEALTKIEALEARVAALETNA
jgi:hypothetical protein